MAIRIFIDEGHNPRNPNSGAEANGLFEQDVTYEVGMQLAALLRENGNFQVKLSRNRKDEVLGNSNASSLRIRVEEASAFKADYFISIHANSSAVESASGSEGYVYSLNSRATLLAKDMIEGISYFTGFKSRGVYARPSLYVLRKTTMPATLIEIGFLTNKEEAELMKTDPSAYAKGLYRGILQYFGFSK